MIVTFISQCEKKALKRTRYILDSFANRIGDNVWQTAITAEGLETVAKRLRQTASRSTAVSCHKNRGSQTTELLWIIGNSRKFDSLGRVPVHSTQRNILHQEWENNWHNLTAVKLITAVAALLHDIGKSTVLFQNKLRSPHNLRDAYRHEWVSLKLFLWLIKDCQSNDDVFDCLSNIDSNIQPEMTHYPYAAIDKLPPLAQWIAWLIVTHHRLPPLPLLRDSGQTGDGYNHVSIANMRTAGNDKYRTTAQDFYRQLYAIDGWVRYVDAKIDEQENWAFNHVILNSPAWQKQIKRYARKCKDNPRLREIGRHGTVTDPFLLNISRLILMTGDHNYSALPANSPKRVSGSPEWSDKLFANTDRTTRQPKQTLDEHLIGVAQYCCRFALALPVIQNRLPALANHNPLAQDTAHDLFKWQNEAVKHARRISSDSKTHGFFAVNMASTGCGKTIANARIAYALADQTKGARFTIALGLRTLTLQTGYSLRRDLGLNEKQLAVLVGGRAKQLFHFNQNNSSETVTDYGSESAEPLIEEYVDSRFDADEFDTLQLGVLTENHTAQNLLYSPVVSCTIDHLMQASEQQRGGRYIIPTLRLLSSDIIFDEPDDFSNDDLPALCRLVHLAGVYGSRVILSSATLQSDQVHGLFAAYLEGRKIYNRQFDLPAPNIPCLWTDEHHSIIQTCGNTEQLDRTHQNFLHKRQVFLSKQPVQRQGEILAIHAAVSKNPKRFYPAIAAQLVGHAINYHHRHHFPYGSKTVSIGLIRMANITPLMQTALAMYACGNVPDDTHIHLAVYHSRQVLLLRNQLETQLDQILNRKNGKLPTDHTALRHTIDAFPNITHHIFIVLASPVCEVGRDHDYDWAIVEPSSMRSIIQLAGRINRHRPDRLPESPNIGIWQQNIRAIKKETYAFTHPGYESSEHPLETHLTDQLITTEQLAKIDAQARIIKPEQPMPRCRLADLEHQVLADLMNSTDINIVNAYWLPETLNRQHTHLIRLSPFRQGETETDYVICPKNGRPTPYHLEQIERFLDFHRTKTAADVIQAYEFAHQTDSPITPWLTSNLEEQINQIAQKLDIPHDTAAIRFATVTLPNRNDKLWYFHEYFGCWQM